MKIRYLVLFLFTLMVGEKSVAGNVRSEQLYIPVGCALQQVGEQEFVLTCDVASRVISSRFMLQIENLLQDQRIVGFTLCNANMDDFTALRAWILSNCTHVVSLSFVNCSNFKDMSFASPTLQSLSFVKCDITGGFIEGIGNLCPQLQHLKVLNCGALHSSWGQEVLLTLIVPHIEVDFKVIHLQGAVGLHEQDWAATDAVIC